MNMCPISNDFRDRMNLACNIVTSFSSLTSFGVTVSFLFSLWPIKCLLCYNTTVSIDCNVVEALLKMPHIHMPNMQICCMFTACMFTASAIVSAAIREYHRRFPTRRIPNRKVFFKIFNRLHESGTLPSVRIMSEWGRQRNVNEEENIIQMIQRNPSISTRRIATRFGTTYTYMANTIWRQLVRISSTTCAKSSQRGQCYASRILSLVTYQLSNASFYTIHWWSYIYA